MNRIIITCRGVYARYLLFILAFLVLMSVKVQAIEIQNFRIDIKVSGSVKSSDGEPLGGVSVKIKGTNKVVNTDNEGKYTINAPSDGTLVFSYVGFEQQEVKIAGKSQLDVTLKAIATALNEVMVVGYGTLQKSDITGSITSVKLGETDELKAVSIAEALQGKVAGVNIITNTGEPGAAMTFNIRGTTSVTGSNQPLIVIDGQPVESSFGATYAGGSNSEDGSDIPPSDPLAALNPNDIESIEILKDASSTAIYGSRGSNGVVLITTKSGKGNAKDNIAFSSRFDMSQVPKKLALLNNYEYMLFKNEAMVNDGLAPTYKQGQLDTAYRMPNTNWQDLIYRNALSQDYQISFSGRENKKYNYLLSGSYSDQQSILINAWYRKGGVRLNYERNVNAKLTIGLRTSLALADRKFGLQSSWTGLAGSSVVLGALWFNPLREPTSSENSGDEDEETFTNNPLTLLHKVTDLTAMRTLISSFTLDYKFSPSLSYQLRAGINDIYSRRNVYYPTGTNIGDNAPGGSAMQAENNNYNYLIDNLISFKKVYHNKHSINAVGGFSWQQWFRQSGSVTNLSFPSNTLTYYNMGAAAYPGRYSNTDRSRALESVLGRINYTYDRRYSVMATGRYDGSSRLAPGNKWMFYPSLGFAWNASNEDFFKKQIKFISSLKLRASIGVSGNDNISIGGSQASYGLNYYPMGVTSIGTGYVVQDFQNPNLKWEKTTQYNLGGDFGFFKEKFSLTIDAYSKVTTDLLINLQLPGSAGLSSYYTNIGKVTNKGIDFEASYSPLKKKAKSLTLNANFSLVNSMVNNMGDAGIIYGRNFFANGSYVLNLPVTAAVAGYGISSFWGYKTNGIYQNQAEINNDPALANDPVKGTIKPGMIKYVDVNGDGQISDEDKTVIGNASPDFTYGFSANFTWRKFSASMTFFGSHGARLLNMNRWMIGANTANVGGNSLRDAYLGRWKGEGTSNLYPALTSDAVRLQGRFPDWMVEDASFFRVQNVTVGYNFNMRKSLNINTIKVFVTGTNLLTFTKYSGYDPNINSFGQSSLNNGIDIATLPQARSLSAGVKVIF